MLVYLIYGVVTFHTVPEEYESLKKVRGVLAC